MLKNYNHDLIQQLSEISDSLWRIDEYKKNAEECDNCKHLWDELRKDYENHVRMISEEIMRHVKEERFD